MNNNYIFHNPNYFNYICQYEGVYNPEYIKNTDIYLTTINNEFAIISINAKLLNNIGDTNFIINLSKKIFPQDSNFFITYVLPPALYTLQEISAITATNVEFLQINLPLHLDGNGIVIGILDTGIDFLNEEFTNENNETRILSIWDQTIIPTEIKNNSVPFGTLYDKSDINKALNLFKEGKNPYDIVPSKDENGHGTKIAGIVGAYGKNKDIKGIANKCEFIIVKLLECMSFKKNFNVSIPIYDLTSIMPAMEYLKNFSLKYGKPVVILLPLGSNTGNHKGKHLLASYIQSLTSNIGIAFVTGTGNEALEDSHVAGFIKNINEESIVQLMVAPEENSLMLDFWGGLPNIFEINIVSPSGEETKFVPAVLNMNKKFSYIFEKTKLSIYYDLPEQYSGEQLIRIYFSNIKSGIWTIKVKLKLGNEGNFDIWMPQNGLKEKGTRFTPSNLYGTITTPSDSYYAISIAAYNQNNRTVLSTSGMYFIDEPISGIDFAAGGFNTLTTGLNNKLDTISGSSLAAAIGAGACALLFQWGIIDNNYPYIHSESLKTFLHRGTIMKRGASYPNAQWGYGIIDFYKIFMNISNI